MATQYDGNPTATQDPASAPGNAVAVKTNLPVDALNVSSIYQPFKVLADWIAWLRDNRARTTYSTTTADAVMTGSPGDGSIQTARGLTFTQGATIVKQVTITLTINLTAGANDVVITLANTLAFATSADIVISSLVDWSGGTATAPLIHAKATNVNEITVYAQGFGEATVCQVSLLVQGT